MRQFVSGIVILFCFFASFGWPQQAANVAYFENVRVKPGDVEKFETALKRHWTWHEKHPDIPILKQAKAEYAKLQ